MSMKWLKLFLSVIKKTKIVVCGLLLIMIGYCVSAQNSPGKTNENTPSAVIHADKTGTPIHPYLYGMFTELLSNMFENGLWSEMLSDRKFFYPVDNSATLVPKNGKGHQNRWRPIGPENVVTLDSANIYVGKHSPKVLLDGKNQNGIKQAGLWLTNGKKYTGRIVLAANPGVTVEVSLVWGSAPTDRQKITISNLSSGFKTYPLSFTSKAENKNCSLEIVGKGKGAFNIGAVSLMPADNLYGFRKDIIDVLKEIHSGPYRWPGGNFVSNYDWRNGIGNPDKRPPRYDFAWNTVESNDVGTDEYLNLCKIAGVDPYICVNAGMGDEYSAAQWVEYVNGKQTTTMGKLRAANGHPEPYNVKNWGVGNEAYGGWQLGHMSSEQFVMKHNFFAEAMHKVDPSIKLIASGASLFESNVSSRLNRQPLQSKVPYAYMSVDDWDGILFKGAYQNMDYVSEHLYPVFNSAYDVQQQKFVTTHDSLVDRIRILSNRVEAMTEAMKEYEKRIPGLKEKNIKFWVDEWTAGRGGFEATLCMVEALQEMIRHTDYIMMGGFTSVGSLFVKNDVAASISSKGLIFKMFHDRFGTIPVEVTGNSPQHEIKGVYLVDKPATPSGSATYPLDVVAALNAGKTKLTISVINATYSEQNLNLNFEGLKVNTNAKTWVMKVPTLNVENKVGEAPVVNFVESQTQLNTTVKVAPLSISLFELEKSN